MKAVFFSQQAVVNMNCQTCTLKFGAISEKEEGRGALKNCVAGYLVRTVCEVAALDQWLKNRSGMKNHVFR